MPPKPTSSSVAYTVPGMEASDAEPVIGLLQDRLNALNDLALTLKHVHWNVVGPQFIAVHTMLDPQVDAMRSWSTPPQSASPPSAGPRWDPRSALRPTSRDDYSIGRADAIAHLGALDVVHKGIIETHRQAIEKTDDPDPVTQDILIAQSAQLEQFHWFVRAHLESTDGTLSTNGAMTEQSAGRRARR